MEQLRRFFGERPPRIRVELTLLEQEVIGAYHCSTHSHQGCADRLGVDWVIMMQRCRWGSEVTITDEQQTADAVSGLMERGFLEADEQGNRRLTTRGEEAWRRIRRTYYDHQPLSVVAVKISPD